MGWASGFAAGSQMAQGWLDTYDKVKTRTSRGLANEEIRKMQQGTTPTQGAQTAPQMSPNPMATAATAPIDISAPAGGLGTAPQMSPITRATPSMLSAVEQVESGGNVNAVSPAGARGPMQLMPATAAQPGYGVSPAMDDTPEENRRVGADYLNAMLSKYDGDVDMALAAYNQGPAATDRWIAAGANPDDIPGGAETRNYAGKVRAAMGGADATSATGRMTMQNIMAQQPQSTEQVRGRMTGLGRAENQLGEESQILDIYRKYNLTDDIASQEDKISGLQTRYDDLSQYERETATAAEKTKYDRAQDTLVNARLQADLDSVQALRTQQITASESAVGYEQATQRREQLDRDAKGAMMGAAVNGMTMAEMAGQVPEAYRENPSEWQNAIATQYMEASGLTATDFTQIVKNIISPIDELLNTTYTSEEAKIKEYNKRLAGLDPDASDEEDVVLGPRDDGGWGVTYGGAIIMEGDTPEDIARQYKESVATSPFGHALDRIDFLRVKALKDSKKFTTAESKRDFLAKLAKDNPAILRDLTLRDELLTSVGFETDGGIDTTSSRWANTASPIQGYGGGENPEGLTTVQAVAKKLADRNAAVTKAENTADDIMRADLDALTPEVVFELTDDEFTDTFSGVSSGLGSKLRGDLRLAKELRDAGGSYSDYAARKEDDQRALNRSFTPIAL